MQLTRKHLALLAATGILTSALSACSDAKPETHKAANPFVIEKAPEGSTAAPKLILEPAAVKRIALRTAPTVDGAPLRVNPERLGVGVPYAALLYKPDGTTFVYAQLAENTFVRRIVLVDHIAGDLVTIVNGLDVGTQVVTTGAAELVGIEFGVGK